MNDTDYLEPKNGDFITYIDKLQQESIDALKVANADRIAHADEMKSSSLRDIASELMKRRKASEAIIISDNSSAPSPLPTIQHSQTLQKPKRPSVAEEFKNTPQRNTRKQASPIFAFANFFLIIGLFLTIFGINAEIDELTGPGLFMMLMGFMILKGVKRR